MPILEPEVAAHLAKAASIQTPDNLFPVPRHPGPASALDNWHAVARFCQQHPLWINEWEKGFLASILAKCAVLTSKQWCVLAKLANRILANYRDRDASGGDDPAPDPSPSPTPAKVKRRHIRQRELA